VCARRRGPFLLPWFGIAEEVDLAQSARVAILAAKYVRSLNGEQV
jgi:predicted methyltransferase MtxX (methanogen marker protein 4)